MIQDKRDFVKKLFELYVAGGNQEGIQDMAYVKDSNSEYVVVKFDETSAKKFSVLGDNPQGILIDFAKFLSNMDAYDWI